MSGKLNVKVTYEGPCYVISLYVISLYVLRSMCFALCASHLHPFGHRVEGIQKLEQIQMVRRVVQ